MKNKFKQDNGTAGLTILLSVIVMLFILGLLIAIFTIMGSEIRSSDMVREQFTSDATTQSSVALNDGAGTSLTTCASSPYGSATFVSAYNSSTSIPSTNFTISGCTLTYVAGIYNGTTISNVTYTYTYAGITDTIMNDTVVGIAGVTDWFDIFVVITAMVVLIALTVIIITAIRSSGMIQGGQTAGANTVGTA